MVCGSFPSTAAAVTSHEAVGAEAAVAADVSSHAAAVVVPELTAVVWSVVLLLGLLRLLGGPSSWYLQEFAYIQIIKIIIYFTSKSYCLSFLWDFFLFTYLLVGRI